MKNWTTQAEQRLVEYLRERVAREGLAGEDAADLTEDLRTHIFEEAERLDSGASEDFGLMHFETVLGKMDGGHRSRPADPTGAAWRAPAEPEPQGSFKRFLLWTFGVVLPLGILVFEMFASFCGSVFFDPVPTLFHAAWIAMIAAVNAWLLKGSWGGAGDRWRGAASAFAAVGAMFYGLLFLPLLHLSILAVLFVGLGLLSLTPVVTAWATWRCGRNARRDAGNAADFRFGWRTGLLAGLLALAALEGPSLWTRANLNLAAGEGVAASAAIGRLRIWHSERTLLKACYEGNRATTMATDVSGWILTGWRVPIMMFGSGGPEMHDVSKVRDLFFRVTGKPFNSLKPPNSHRGGGLIGRGDPLGQMEFDDHLGGDQVAVRLKHLDLAESRFDGHVDSVSGLGYGEWTMVFKNSSGAPKEARCQVRLPREGRVSRLTLWVNGEPREAAFSTVSKVKAAYRSVAVVQRLDPVLVNVVGPDTVMVQCFPVPAHGEMKIRLGVTAPLDGGRWEIPHVIERNFGLAESLKHALWLQGDRGFELTGNGEPLNSGPDGDGHALPTSLEGGSVASASLAVRLAPAPGDPLVVWCEDRFASAEERFLIREPITKAASPSGSPVIVIDGSASMKEARKWLVKALAGFRPGEVEILLADDHARRVTPGDLESSRFSGGRDNEPALREALRLARETGGPIVWVHGPQAVALSQPEALTQLLERGTVRSSIFAVEAVPGPNRLAEALFKTGSLRRGPALESPREDFHRFLETLRTGGEQSAWNWRRSAESGSLEGKQVWDHLARCWAAGEVENPRLAMTDAARSELAARYQLVTPFSGAVVLETARQYADHGLTPVDGDATPQIPNVPEPSTSLLLLVAAAAAVLRRKR